LSPAERTSCAATQTNVLKECFSAEKVGGHHIDYQTLMNHRPELECRRLILTHINDEMLRQLGSLDVEGAADGKIVVLQPGKINDANSE
jgi:hypothetical protein